MLKKKSIIGGHFFKLNFKWVLKNGSGCNSLLECLPFMSKALIYMSNTIVMVALSYSEVAWNPISRDDHETRLSP